MHAHVPNKMCAGPVFRQNHITCASFHLSMFVVVVVFILLRLLFIIKRLSLGITNVGIIAMMPVLCPGCYQRRSLEVVVTQRMQ